MRAPQLRSPHDRRQRSMHSRRASTRPAVVRSRLSTMSLTHHASNLCLLWPWMRLVLSRSSSTTWEFRAAGSSGLGLGRQLVVDPGSPFSGSVSLHGHSIADDGGACRRVINVAGQAGTSVAPNASAYAVAKVGFIRLTEHVDLERRAQGIPAFAIQLGTIHTAMSAQTLASIDARRHAVSLLESVTADASDEARAKLQTLCVDLAGWFDVLSGRYLEVVWDLSKMFRGDAA